MVVYYGTSTGKIRRIVHDPSRRDSDLRTAYPALTGETSIAVPDAAVPDIDALQARLNLVTGKSPGRDVNRCCVIDPTTFEVKRVIRANPLLDTVPDGTLLVNAAARIGYRLRRNGLFQRSEEEIQHDIDAKDALQAKLDSRLYRDAQLADPDGTPVEVLDAAVAQLDLDIEVLVAEKTTRQAPRT